MSDNYSIYSTMEYLIHVVYWDAVSLLFYNEIVLILFCNLLWAD